MPHTATLAVAVPLAEEWASPEDMGLKFVESKRAAHYEGTPQSLRPRLITHERWLAFRGQE
jgi:hypothetical protein